jgi:flagellar protein FliS
MSNPQAITQKYRMNQINSASPLDLVLMTYDAALIACGQRDLERTTNALSVLRNALDFNYDADIAMGLFRLYQYCGDLARKGEYDEAAQVLRELRDTWVQVKAQYVMAPNRAAVAPVSMNSQTMAMATPSMAISA